MNNNIFHKTFGPDLRQVYQDTMRMAKERGYDRDIVSVAHKQWTKGTIDTASPKFDTKLSVVNEDCLVVAEEMIHEGLNPAVLNMANAFRPGGGVVNGARAQEETIFRRSNLFQSLYRYDIQHALTFGVVYEEQLYPMDENFGGIYSGGITVFKDKGYEVMAQTFKTAFISVAALNISMAERFHERHFMENGHLTDEAIEITKNKIRTKYRIGVANGHDSLVLGAWGCGAFGNPPREMAQLFMDVLEEDEFHGRYRDIRFAIIEDHNSQGRNVASFREVLENEN